VAVANISAQERKVNPSGSKLERVQLEFPEGGAQRKRGNLAKRHQSYFKDVRTGYANEGQARAVQFVAPYLVELADVVVPEPGPGDVLVRAEFSGISGGTEMLAYRGELDSSAPRDDTLSALTGSFEYPFTYGYSAVGTVEASRSEVGEGERIFAFHPHQSRFIISATDIVPVGEYDPRAATLFPLVETALQISLDAGIRYSEFAAVLGLGPVGILAAILLSRSGATVVASDPKPWRRDAARTCGLEAVSPDRLRDAVRDATGERGADVIVEATGNPDALGEGLELLSTAGVAIVASWYGAKPVTLPLGAEFHRQRLEIRSSQVSTVDGRAVRWDRQRRLKIARALLPELPLALLCSHTFHFERAREAYAALDRGDEGVVHVALSYS
jgi:2-desacetyl-2-hydroxyethyl bacteriochlorophyllide A dehydrogenase